MINEISHQIKEEKEILLKTEKEVNEILIENQRKIEVKIFLFLLFSSINFI